MVSDAFALAAANLAPVLDALRAQEAALLSPAGSGGEGGHAARLGWQRRYWKRYCPAPGLAAGGERAPAGSTLDAMLGATLGSS